MKLYIITTLFLILIFPKIALTQNPEIKGLKSKIIEIKNQKVTQLTGYIEVPEDREKSDGRILNLPIHIYKSSNPTPQEPIFWLNGGPGSPNISKFTNTVLLENSDVVMIGYRGADGSSALVSKKVSKAIKGKNHQLLSDESFEHTNSVVEKYLSQLNQKGIDITKYTMLDVIEDLEYVRNALGTKHVNLLSVSYGTRVALLYSYKYPEAIKRSVMVGANPPGHFVWYADKTEQILEKYDSLYKTQNLPGSIKEAMEKAFKNIPKRWSVFRLDVDKIKAMTFGVMYSIDGSAMVFDAYFRAANKGDYSGLYLLQLFFDIGMSKNNLWGDMFAKGLSADFEPKKDYLSWMRSFDKTTILGSNYSELLWGLSKSWNSFLMPEEYRKLRTSDTETLILSGNLDNSTPADFATEKLLPTLTRGKQVILKDYSHSMLGAAQKEQIRGMVANYFVTGTVDDSKIEYQPIDFKPKKSLNKMAKWGYPVVLILSWIY
jgi:pimeloyl-ACP methyl ester carboxylesterase